MSVHNGGRGREKDWERRLMDGDHIGEDENGVPGMEELRESEVSRRMEEDRLLQLLKRFSSTFAAQRSLSSSGNANEGGGARKGSVDAIA